MLLRYIFIRSSKRSGADTEFPDSDIFGADIRPSLEGHGIFGYILGISEKNYLTLMVPFVINYSVHHCLSAVLALLIAPYNYT